MRDAWEVTHSLAGGGKEEGGHRGRLWTGRKGPGGWLCHFGGIGGKGKFRVGLGAFDNLKNMQGKPPGGLWVSGAHERGHWRVTRPLTQRKEFYAEEKLRVDSSIRVPWGKRGG